MGIRFYDFDVKMTCERDVTNFIEIGWAEAEKMTV